MSRGSSARLPSISGRDPAPRRLPDRAAQPAARGHGGGERAAAVEHFLSDGHADTFLELETHQRYGAVEAVGRFIEPAGAKQRHDPDQISGYANPVIAPVAPARSSSSRNTPPSPPKMRTGSSPHAARMREVLNGVGGSSSLIVRAPRNLACDPREQRRLHGEPGDGRVILHDDLDVHSLGRSRRSGA